MFQAQRPGQGGHRQPVPGKRRLNWLSARDPYCGSRAAEALPLAERALAIAEAASAMREMTAGRPSSKGLNAEASGFPAVAELGLLPFALIDTDADDWRIMQLAEAGRGLALVDALCDRLTWQPNSSGGTVVRCHWRLKAATDTAHNKPQPSNHAQG